jgi:hypothetical protein
MPTEYEEQREPATTETEEVSPQRTAEPSPLSTTGLWSCSKPETD